MNNWFEVGEEVGVVSKSYPEINGDYKIIAVLTPQEAAIRCGAENYIERFLSGSYYVLQGLLFEDKNNKHIVYDFAGIGSLRKKHKGSEMRYNEMIKSLNVDIVEVV